MNRFLILALLAAGCVDDASATTQAEALAADGSGAPHRPPPKEAFDACASSTADATCAFDIDSHHVTGTCKHGPDGAGPLACVPDRPPPPPEAIAACTSSTAGASCSFDVDSHHVDGTCHAGPDAAAPLACAPVATP
jgi:hypothetical protein